MHEEDLPLIKSLASKINAIEKTILNSPMKDEYVINLKEWREKMDKIVDDANQVEGH